MHRIPSPNLALRSAQRGFSLPEVAMAIGIIAVAFVALLSLLPAGLNTYRAAIDDANETWIIQSMNSLVQTSDFARIPDLAYDKSQEIYYFDEEGKLTDTALNESTEQKVINSRVYAVKLIIGDMYRPSGETENAEDQKMTHGLRVVTVIAPYLDQKAMVDFGRIDRIENVEDLPPATKVHTRTFMVARMDSQSS